MLISVIIPIYKVENYIHECVDSVLSQSYTNIEILLVDDGSPDNCPAICDQYAEQDSRITVIHKENGGLSDARNFGLKAAKGDYVLFLDSDDYWSEVNAIQAGIDVIRKYDNVDIIYFDNVVKTSKGVCAPPAPFDLDLINGKNKIEVLSYFIGNSKFIISACFKFIRRSLLIDNNISFQKGLLSEDYDWNFALTIKAENLYAINNPFYVYLRREGSITNTISEKNLYDVLSIIKKWYVLIPELVSDKEEKRLYMGYLGFMYGMLISLLYLAPSKSSRREVIEQMKPYRSLLNLGINKKTRMVRIVYRLMGFGLTWRILGMYNKKRKSN